MYLENVIVVDEMTLELTSDAKIGDRIDLSKLLSIDRSKIIEAINEEKDKVYKEKLEANNREFDLKLKAINEKHDAELKSYEANNRASNLELENKIKETYSKEINDLKSELITLNSELKTKEELTRSKVSNDYEAKIRDLKSENDSMINDLKMSLTENKMNNEKSLMEQSLKYEKELESSKNQILELQTMKNALGVKPLGEALEKWCNEEYESHALTGFTNCTWIKDNEAVKLDENDRATKADYIFRVYSDESKTTEITSVCADMKNENCTSGTKKKNSDHYAKLDKDRIKKNCTYALLISELERDSNNDAPIIKVNDYKDMYMVRPQYFVSFLGVIYALANKYKEIILAKEKEGIKFKESQEILDEYSELKRKYLDYPIDTLTKAVAEIKDNSDAIMKANTKIQNSCDTLINKTLSEMKAKIERFDIKHLTGKILDLEDNSK